MNTAHPRTADSSSGKPSTSGNTSVAGTTEYSARPAIEYIAIADPSRRFNLDVPTSCPGVPAELLNARNTWEDRAAYDETAEKLAQMFVDNAEKRLTTMAPEIRAAGPRPIGR